MEIFRLYRFRAAKAPVGGELFEALLGAVGPTAASRARFRLEDRQDGASAIARARGIQS